ncbi:hypothetical protein ACFY93_14785 [Streptomyces sp. NPDC008313]|uniref:hypothetical protein n=1 Tax=Streptomyces sp. NPDC008313 TaxID=3364826 RepID=UPI0036E49DCF
MTSPGTNPSGDGHAGGPARPDPGEPVPRVLADVRALTALTEAPSGALWKLAEPGRQLDANLVHLPPRGHVDTHAEPDLDVLFLVTGGSGTMSAADDGTEGPRTLAEGTLMWLPHGSRRSLAAGDDGLFYLTVHRRRPGLRIRSAP